jgi:intracellular septation protein A
MMNFDLRLPLGLIFSLYGIILIGTGLTSTPEMIRQTLGQNINLGWGMVQLLFGLVMLFLSRRKK